jgi:2-C-methyl-D-erythritol 4-phosphate cytidylyltransferase
MSEFKPIKDLGIIIAAGGRGSRFASTANVKSKLFAKIDNTPIFIHSVRNFIGLCPAEQFWLVIKESNREEFETCLKKYLPEENVNLIAGGETRMHSVFNGLQAMPEPAKFVAVHDAARPFATSQLLLACLEQARKHNSAIVAKRVTDTVKKANSDNFITETVDRNVLWTVETPQIFHRKTLINAYRKAFADGIVATDDAGVMEHSGYNSFLFEHKGDNRKLTFAEDLSLDAE